MEKLIILDYSTGMCHIYNYADNPDNVVDTLEKMGFKEDETAWMLTHSEPSVLFHGNIIEEEL